MKNMVSNCEERRASRHPAGRRRIDQAAVPLASFLVFAMPSSMSAIGDRDDGQALMTDFGPADAAPALGTACVPPRA